MAVSSNNLNCESSVICLAVQSLFISNDFAASVHIWSHFLSHLLGFLFSSPENEVLMVSYCDQSLSIVRRPCVVNFLLQTTSPKKQLDRF